MDSYSQPWTVIAKIEKYENEENWVGKDEKTYSRHHEQNYKPVYYSKIDKPEYYYKTDKPESHLKSDKFECYYKNEKPQYYNHKPEYYNGKPEYYNHKLECYSGKPEYYYKKGEKNTCHYHEEKKTGRSYLNDLPEWNKLSEKLENMNIDGGLRWRSEEGKCCDEDMVKQVKNLISILIGAEQSYIQLGYLCMDEKFTLVNTAEYFRLCGLRMHWLANNLIKKSCRLFNVNEWINNTHIENWFKVPTKEELATNDFTSILKTLFKTSFEAETRLFEVMNMLGDKIMKRDVINTECRFDGLKWFVNFVLPYQMHFLNEVKIHFKNIEMCNNGYIFDKCEMSTLVNKIEEFIHRLVKVNLKLVTEKVNLNKW